MHDGDARDDQRALGRRVRKPVAAVGKLQVLHRSQKRLGFHLDSLRKQLPGAPDRTITIFVSGSSNSSG